MIVAQATVLEVPILTADPRVRQYPVETLVP
jgi:PIN domain nuclease of toxin-antitoxin system